MRVFVTVTLLCMCGLAMANVNTGKKEENPEQLEALKSAPKAVVQPYEDYKPLAPGEIVPYTAQKRREQSYTAQRRKQIGYTARKRRDLAYIAEKRRELGYTARKRRDLAKEMA